MLKVSGSKPLPVGGCLSLFQKAWTRLTDEEWVRSVIQKGYKISFHTLPPTTSSPLCKTQQDKTSPTYQAIKTEIHSLLIKHTIEEAKDVIIQTSRK
ncbi:hypothetical protein BDF14DRAFT_1813761 [Spinellus fusiger]|nr:hypothetical protein BDF14DRAFT_1813761 [Spinellus fusiger]